MTLIAVTLATLPDLVKRRLRSKLTSDKDWARNEIAKLPAAKLDNDSSMVVVPELSVIRSTAGRASAAWMSRRRANGRNGWKTDIGRFR